MTPLPLDTLDDLDHLYSWGFFSFPELSPPGADLDEPDGSAVCDRSARSVLSALERPADADFSAEPADHVPRGERAGE